MIMVDSPPSEQGRAHASWLACAGCGTTVAPGSPFLPACPTARPDDDIDHVLGRHLDSSRVDRYPAVEPNPFIRYRTRLHSYHVAMAADWSDQRYVDLVGRLDEAVAVVDGHGFTTTPVARSPHLDGQLGFAPGSGVWIKDETGNVGGSHKARHLMGILLGLRVAEALSLADANAVLAIASCGNAALAAAVVARAADRRLRVFVPTSAEPAVIERLRELGADIEVCQRDPGEAGDPTYARLVRAVADGAVPFTVQGNLNGHAIEGGSTLGWELIDQLADHGAVLDRLVIHVGGGAFASAQALAFEESLDWGRIPRQPRFDTVQTRGGYPLVRAHHLVLDRLGLEAGQPLSRDAADVAVAEIARHRSAYMWPWETEPASIAHGILDDETYDWLAVVRAMLLTGGRSVAVDEELLEEANSHAVPDLDIDADHTGTAGLAGLIQLTRDGFVSADETVAVIFSGARRDPPAAPRPQIERGTDT